LIILKDTLPVSFKNFLLTDKNLIQYHKLNLFDVVLFHTLEYGLSKLS